MMTGLRCVVWCLAVLAMAPCMVQASIWQDVTPSGLAAKGINAEPLYYRSLRADQDQLRQTLASAPREDTSSQGATITLPLPQGGNQAFELVESPILSSALAAEYPEISTYRVRGIDDPSITGRLDMTPQGFHAMLTTPAGSIFIDPDQNGGYRSFYKQAYAAALGEETPQHICRMSELSHLAEAETTSLPALSQRTVSGNQRRIYQLAVATTGEYGQYFHGARSVITSNIVTTINRVNEIYGRDLAVQLQLSAVVIYTNPSTDPYDPNGSLVALLAKNQEILDYQVGVDNYDIGHVFGLSGGGLASLGAACTSFKAQGYTGHPTPVGDVFYIDFVSHEMGHQLNATHSFNGTTLNCAGANREASTAVEPGSGSTIMAYAGICGGENLQLRSEATFHAASIDQIHTFVFAGVGSQCGALNTTGNTPPTSNAGADASIPQGTPFVLTGDLSTDPDGDTLSYQWDEMDSGGATGSTTVDTIGRDLGAHPLLRSFVPKSTPTRYFPRLSTLLSGVPNIGETLPTTPRTLNFRMTVRDGNSGVADDDLVVSVDTSQGPFQIDGGDLNASGSQSYLGGSIKTLTWNPAGTNTGCPDLEVSLLSLSSDHSTYCDKDDDPRLDLNPEPNTDQNIGTASVMLPIAQIAHARVMLKCANNIFFDLSDNDFAVTAATNPIASDCKAIDGTPLEHGTVFTSPTVDQSTSIGGGGGGGGGGLLWLPLLLGLASLLRIFVGRCGIAE